MSDLHDAISTITQVFGQAEVVLDTSEALFQDLPDGVHEAVIAECAHDAAPKPRLRVRFRGDDGGEATAFFPLSGPGAGMAKAFLSLIPNALEGQHPRQRVNMEAVHRAVEAGTRFRVRVATDPASGFRRVRVLGRVTP